jgi:cobalt/nickel transport system permease protein
MKLPKVFVIQLLFLYRYLFVLLEESLRMIRARDARSFGSRGKEIKTFIRLISVLLIRSIERAERIFRAMLARGFRGEIKVLKRHRLEYYDILFGVISITTFYLFRTFPVVNLLGETFNRMLQ